MAKKSKSKSKSKSKKDAAEEAAKKAAKRARERAKQLADAAKDLRRSADKAGKKADRAEAKARDARSAAGLETPAAPAQPDETELLRLALRSAEAKLTDAERRLEAAQQQLADRDREDEEAVEEALEDAVVDAAVEATVADAVADAVVDSQLEGDAVIEAEIVEAIAIDLDGAAEQAEPAPEQPSHEGEAQAAAEVFEQSAGADGDADTAAAPDTDAGPAVVADEAAPPLPAAPADDQPNEAWTLVRLRQEAKNRGLAGISNLSKGALLARLREG